MSSTRRGLLVGALAIVFGTTLSHAASAADWQKDYPKLTLGVITSENEADRLLRYEPVRDYLESRLGVEIQWRSATDYAGIIEGVKAKKVEIARFGPASYAQAYLVTNGQVEPLVGELDPEGDFGYKSVVIVRKDSPYQQVEDLKGKTFAFADPNSTSGYQAPLYFLHESGIDAKELFGTTTFSGSHENSVMGLVNGTFDGVATWYRDAQSNMSRMESKGMIEPGQWRIIWESPVLPSSPWAMPTWLPVEMREQITAVLMAMPKEGPEAWEALTDGKASAFREVTHSDYEPIVRMIQHNNAQRRGS